jgi:RimJ/RimL family protein N-acetyltransferase
MTFETAHLLFRQPRLADAPALFEFLGDATAMQYGCSMAWTFAIADADRS